MAELWTKDLFKASYLLNKCQRLQAVRLQNGEKQYLIKGDYVHIHDFRYKTGRALINPIIFKETYRYLESVKEQDRLLLYHISQLLQEEYGDFPETEALIAI